MITQSVARGVAAMSKGGSLGMDQQEGAGATASIRSEIERHEAKMAHGFLHFLFLWVVQRV
jgi:hypothetical protein